MTLKIILRCFQVSSGLKINLSKSFFAGGWLFREGYSAVGGQIAL